LKCKRKEADTFGYGNVGDGDVKGHAQSQTNRTPIRRFMPLNPRAEVAFPEFNAKFFREPAYWGKGQLVAGYKIGPGLHGSESCPAFTLKSPGSELVEFKPPPPNAFKAEPSNPKPDGPNAFRPVPSNRKPRKPKAPKSKAKPNKSGTNAKSVPPNEFSRGKEVSPRSNWCSSPNRGDPNREAFDLDREWESEEWPNEELANREFAKSEFPRLRSKKEVDFSAFAEENSCWPDQLLEVDAAFGGRFGLKEDVDRAALAREVWPGRPQLLGADTAFGGRLALREDGDLGALAKEN
jgi:hypothetical protein